MQKMTTMNNKLLEGLTGEGIVVSISDLARYSASNGVNVSVKVGRSRGYLNLPLKALGIKLDQMQKEGRDFFHAHVSTGVLSFIPREHELELIRIESALRRRCDGLSLCGGYMPLSSYNLLKEEHQELREKYFAKRDEIVSEWENLKESFCTGVTGMLKEIPMSDEDKVSCFQQIAQSIPSAQNYADSFYMTLNVQAFPAENGVLEGLEESIASEIDASWQDSVVANAVKSIEKLIGNVFGMLGKASSTYSERSKINQRTLHALSEFGLKLQIMNVFRNPLLTKLVSKMKAIETCGNDTDAEEKIEECLLDVYEYGKEAGLHLDYSQTPFNASMLDMMSRNRARM